MFNHHKNVSRSGRRRGMISRAITYNGRVQRPEKENSAVLRRLALAILGAAVLSGTASAQDAKAVIASAQNVLGDVTSITYPSRFASHSAGANTTNMALVVAVVTMVRAESDVGLPNGPTWSTSVIRPATSTLITNPA